MAFSATALTITALTAVSRPASALLVMFLLTIPSTIDRFVLTNPDTTQRAQSP
jgi:hypothetical protein